MTEPNCGISSSGSSEPVANETLLALAWKARASSYSPYSRFAVGAAVLGGSGRLYSGCNVENASYGLTICAERVAIYSAVVAGEREIRKVAIVAENNSTLRPCGACLQVLQEFAPRVSTAKGKRHASEHVTLILSCLEGAVETFTLADLFPHPFVLNG